MAVCLASDANGALVVDTTKTLVSDCQLVALTGAEVSQLQASPFYLDSASGIKVGVAILLCWAVAWLFRVVRVPLSGSIEPISEE